MIHSSFGYIQQSFSVPKVILSSFERRGKSLSIIDQGQIKHAISTLYNESSGISGFPKIDTHHQTVTESFNSHSLGDCMSLDSINQTDSEVKVRRRPIKLKIHEQSQSSLFSNCHLKNKVSIEKALPR